MNGGVSGEGSRLYGSCSDIDGCQNSKAGAYLAGTSARVVLMPENG